MLRKEKEYARLNNKLFLSFILASMTATVGLSLTESSLISNRGISDVVYADFKSENPHGNILSNGTLSDLTTGATADANGNLSIDSVTDTIKLTFDWSLYSVTGYQYQAGDVFNFEIPSALHIANEVNFNLTTEDGTAIGIVRVTKDGVGTITFTDAVTEYASSHTNIHGNIQFQTAVDTAQASAGKTVTVNTQVPGTNGNTSITITKPDTGDYTPGESIHGASILTKMDGYVSEDAVREYFTDDELTKNPDILSNPGKYLIFWVIKVNNPALNLKEVKLTDIMESSQQLIESSLQITQVGKAAVTNQNGIDVTKQFATAVTPTTVNINFGDINHAYFVTYYTKITNHKDYSIDNTATLSTGGQTNSDNSVHAVTTGSGGVNGDKSTIPTTPETPRPNNPDKIDTPEDSKDPQTTDTQKTDVPKEQTRVIVGPKKDDSVEEKAGSSNAQVSELAEQRLPNGNGQAKTSKPEKKVKTSLASKQGQILLPNTGVDGNAHELGISLASILFVISSFIFGNRYLRK